MKLYAASDLWENKKSKLIERRNSESYVEEKLKKRRKGKYIKNREENMMKGKLEIEEEWQKNKKM